MRNISLLLFIFVFIVSLNSYGQIQNKVDYMEIVESDLKLKNELEKLYRENSALDLWRVDSTRTYYFPSEEDSLAVEKESYYYHIYGNRIEYVKMQRSNENTGWLNSSRNTIIYLDNGMLTDLVRYEWKNSFWRERRRTQYLYSQSGKVINQISYNWDSISSSWINETKVDYKYNSLGINNLIFLYTTDNINHNWQYLQKDSTYFDEYNREKELYRDYWNTETLLWDKWERIIYSYETDVRAYNRDYWNEGEWVQFAKGDGYIIDSVTEMHNGYTYDDVFGWEHNYKVELGYSLNGEIISQESYRLPDVHGPWLGEAKFERLFNESGLSVGSIYYDWNYWAGEWYYQRKTSNSYNDDFIVDYSAKYQWYNDSWYKVESKVIFFKDISSVESNNQNELQIILYPNPVVNTLNISPISNDKVIWSYNIYNYLGSQLGKGIITDGTVNVENLEAGIYIIEIRSEKASTIKKFIRL